MAGARVIIWFESSCRLFSHFTPHSARPAPLHYFVIIVANGLFAYWLQLQKAKCGSALDRLVVATRPQLRFRRQSQLFLLSTSRQCDRVKDAIVIWVGFAAPLDSLWYATYILLVIFMLIQQLRQEADRMHYRNLIRLRKEAFFISILCKDW